MVLAALLLVSNSFKELLCNLILLLLSSLLDEDAALLFLLASEVSCESTLFSVSTFSVPLFVLKASLFELSSWWHISVVVDVEDIDEFAEFKTELVMMGILEAQATLLSSAIATVTGSVFASCLPEVCNSF